MSKKRITTGSISRLSLQCKPCNQLIVFDVGHTPEIRGKVFPAESIELVGKINSLLDEIREMDTHEFGFVFNEQDVEDA